MWSHTFWVAVAERSLKTWAQSAAALLTGNGFGLLDVNWVQVVSVSGLAALVSVLTSIGSGYVGNDGPSLAGEELDE